MVRPGRARKQAGIPPSLDPEKGTTVVDSFSREIPENGKLPKIDLAGWLMHMPRILTILWRITWIGPGMLFPAPGVDLVIFKGF